MQKHHRSHQITCDVILISPQSVFASQVEFKRDKMVLNTKAYYWVVTTHESDDKKAS